MKNFLAAMDMLDGGMEGLLDSVKGNPFAVYHNAFQYYEKQFGLQHVASFTENEEVQPGIRKVLEIRQLLQANEVACILLEPGNNPAQIRQLTGMEMQMVSIDVLGFDYGLSKSGYAEFMQGLSLSIAGCLEPLL